MNYYKYKDGRVWIQRKKFLPYMLLLPYGMTGVTDPTGGLNAIREPSASKRGQSVIVDIVRAEPGLPQFQLETRLRKTLNYMFGLKDCASNFQAHLGSCDVADNYFGSSLIMHWERSHRGDLSVDRLSLIEGDNNAINMQVPFVAEVGPLLFDMDVSFLSARTILETEGITGMAFLDSECLSDCRSQEDAGDNGYLVTTALVGSTTNIANVWYTENMGETWTLTSQTPFGGGIDISSIIVAGTKTNHRVIVSAGTTQPSDPAQVAYADVTAIGTTAWVVVNVGAIDAEFITKLFMLDWAHVYALTDGGNIYMSADGGVTWTIVYDGSTQLNDISGLNTGILWAAGDANLVIYSADYGESWTVVSGPADGSADDNDAIHVTPDGTVFVGNDAGELYGSYDDGVTWTTLPLQGITPTAVTDISSWGDSDIWVVADTASGGRVLRSIDGGAAFKLWQLNMPTNFGLNCIAVVDPNIVLVGGDPHSGSGFISRTTSRVIGL